MKKNTALAIATTLGVAPDTLALLTKLGLTEADQQKRFVDLAVFSNQTQQKLLPYLQRGVTLTTLEVAALIIKDSKVAEDQFGPVVNLAHLIGEFSERIELPGGKTIYHGQIVTEGELTQLKGAELAEAGKKAGLSPTASSVQGPETALPSTGGGVTISPTEGPAPQAAVFGPGQKTFSDRPSAQEEILACLLETEPNPERLLAFINKHYDGNAVRAYVALGQDEDAFAAELDRFRGDGKLDQLLTAPLEDDDLEEQSALGQAGVISLDDLAEQEEQEEETED